MIRIKNIFVGLLLFSGITLSVHAQERPIFDLLQTNVNVKGAALGEAYLGLGNALSLYGSQPISRSASVGPYANYSLGLLPRSDNGRLKTHAIELGCPISDRFNIMAGMRYQSGLFIPSVDMSGREGATIHPIVWSADFGTSTMVSKQLSAFTGISYLQSHYGDLSRALVASVGSSYKGRFHLANKTLPADYIFTVKMADIGALFAPKAEKKWFFSSKVQIGSSVSVQCSTEYKLTLAAMGSYLLHSSERYPLYGGVGLEASTSSGIALRSGYYRQGVFSKYTMGAGYRYSICSLDFAYQIASKKDFNNFSFSVRIDI